jgi:glyoxylase-like metal-dependent hydrolase (beta-lactamase superfamily II)
MTSTLRVLHPTPGIVAFYDGRIEGRRLHSPGPNWLDDGAYSLGVCNYAVVDRGDALVYDTHISIDHAQFVRRTLEDSGVNRIRVVLSHWHRDHVAGNEVFGDCEIIAHRLTAQALDGQRVAIETGNPPIRPLVMPTRTYEGALPLRVGDLQVELRHADIHSSDGTLLFLPGSGMLLAGDALEDPITYVAEPERLASHLADLDRIAAWPIRRILPNHGDPDVIARGGYDASLIPATRRYVEKLLACRSDPDLARARLLDWIAPDLAAGALTMFEPYEAVHRGNLQKMLQTT